MRLNNRFPIAVLVCALTLASGALAQMSSISYQGKLNDGASAAAGPHDFRFRLYDGLSSPMSLAESFAEDVQVSGGIFKTEMSFDSGLLFGLDEAWIEIAIRPGASTGAYTVLNPRQRFSETPFASKALRSTYAIGAGFADEANLAYLANEATTATTAQTAVTAQNATNATFATNAGHATTATSATSSTNATNATNAVNAQFAGSALTASSAGTATVATTANDALRLGGILAEQYAKFKWNIVAGDQAMSMNQGYVITSVGESNLQLPFSPQVGDVIRVVTQGDQSTFLVLPVPSQTFVRSGATSRWTQGTIRAASIACSADGTKAVASDYSASSDSPIFRSANGGMTWNQLSQQTAGAYSLASSSDGTRLISATSSGVYGSDDSGSTWSLRSPAVFGRIVSSADGTKLLAAGASAFFTSADSGVTWTQRQTFTSFADGTASSSDGNKLAAVGGSQLYLSSDSGQNWQTVLGLQGVGGVAMSGDGQKLLIKDASPGGGTVLKISTNGGTTFNTVSDNRLWRGIAVSSDGSTFVASSTSTDVLISTNDGANWTPSSAPYFLDQFCLSDNGQKILAGSGAVGERTIQVYSTSPGGTGLRGQNSVEFVYVGQGKFLVASSAGVIQIF